VISLEDLFKASSLLLQSQKIKFKITLFSLIYQNLILMD